MFTVLFYHRCLYNSQHGDIPNGWRNTLPLIDSAVRTDPLTQLQTQPHGHVQGGCLMDYRGNTPFLVFLPKGGILERRMVKAKHSEGRLPGSFIINLSTSLEASQDEKRGRGQKKKCSTELGRTQTGNAGSEQEAQGTRVGKNN